MIATTVTMLLARIWEANAREEKEEKGTDKDDTKQASNYQLHFRCHLLVVIIAKFDKIQNAPNKITNCVQIHPLLSTYQYQCYHHRYHHTSDVLHHREKEGREHVKKEYGEDGSCATQFNVRILIASVSEY